MNKIPQCASYLWTCTLARSSCLTHWECDQLPCRCGQGSTEVSEAPCRPSGPAFHTKQALGWRQPSCCSCSYHTGFKRAEASHQLRKHQLRYLSLCPLGWRHLAERPWGKEAKTERGESCMEMSVSARRSQSWKVLCRVSEVYNSCLANSITQDHDRKEH